MNTQQATLVYKRDNIVVSTLSAAIYCVIEEVAGRAGFSSRVQVNRLQDKMTVVGDFADIADYMRALLYSYDKFLKVIIYTQHTIGLELTESAKVVSSEVITVSLLDTHWRCLRDTLRDWHDGQEEDDD